MAKNIKVNDKKEVKQPRMEVRSKGERALSFEHACKRFKDRFTQEHVPGWAKHLCKRTNKYPAPRYHNDQEWYKNTEFIGFQTQAERRYCRSSKESWPVGRWLDAPYIAGEFTKQAKAQKKAKRYPTKAAVEAPTKRGTKQRARVTHIDLT